MQFLRDELQWAVYSLCRALLKQAQRPMLCCLLLSSVHAKPSQHKNDFKIMIAICFLLIKTHKKVYMCTLLGPSMFGTTSMSHAPPSIAGTQIADVLLDVETAGVRTVKGFATIDNVALINVEVRRSNIKSC